MKRRKKKRKREKKNRRKRKGKKRQKKTLSQMPIGLYAKQPLFLSGFNGTRTLIFYIFFEKILKYKLYENPSSGSGIVPCRRTDGRTYRQT